MNLTPLHKRYLLFLGGCIPMRLLFVYLSKNGSVMMQTLLGYLFFMIATGFMVIYLFGLRKTGTETGGQPIWWNSLRPVHSIIYYLASWCILFGDRNQAWKLLLGDVAIGLSSFLIHHFT